MTEDELQKKLSLLPNKFQVAFLIGCVEHVYPICEGNEIVRRFIELSWQYAINNIYNESEIEAITNVMDKNIDEDTDSEILYVSAAAELVVKTLFSPNEKVVQILNNIEAAISVVDPEPEIGIVEERQWQEKALKTIGTTNVITRDVFTQIFREKMNWIARFENN